MATSCLLGSAVAQAEMAFDPYGSMRMRYESKKDYNFDDASQNYLLSQLRLGLKGKVNQQHSFVIELQDARIFNESKNAIPGINENARNQPFADQLDLHRFYWQYQQGDYSVKIGRQKLNLGDQRLVASLEWVNTARVHDGIRVSYEKTKGTKLDVFATALVSVQPDSFNDQSFANNRYFDSGFHGIYYSDQNLLATGQLDLWWFLRENSRLNDEIHTLGAKYSAKQGKFSYNIQGAIQEGDFSDLDHSAHYLHAGVNYSLTQGKIGLAYNLASGDNNTSDSEHKTFDNLYPLNHAYYGFMDMFSLQNIHNLELVYQRSGWRLAWQSFWLNDTEDQWYNAGLRGNSARQNIARNSNAGSHVGNEIDLSYKKAFLDKSLMLMAGASVFMTGDYVEDTGTTDKHASFFFFQAKYSF